MMSREYAASVVANVTAIDTLFGDDSSTAESAGHSWHYFVVTDR
jgi:hypothetical protein